MHPGGVDKVPHIIQLGFLEVIFGDADVCFDNLGGRGILPCGKPHVLFLCTGPLHNQFCGRMTVYGKMDLVLDADASTGRVPS